MLPKPRGRQSDVLYLEPKGNVIVLGTAGSGKTTLAILRAKNLQTKTDPPQRTLLVTFNRTLVNYLKSLAVNELRYVDVENFHHFALGYLKSMGKPTDRCVIGPTRKRKLISLAISELKTKYPGNPTLNRSTDEFVEEISWIEKSGIKSLDGYVKIERKGRQGSRILRRVRPIFYEVYERYLELRSREGHHYDWEDIASFVIKAFEEDESERLYKHVIIDEGQDFSPVMLRSLVNAIPDDGSLTFFGDAAQQIYGGRLSWRSAGIKNPKIWEFKENYRNTKQIADLALEIAKMPSFKGLADIVEPTSPMAAGPLPARVKFKNEKEETEFVADRASSMGRTQTVAILLRNRRRDQTFINHEKLASLNPIKIHKKMAGWKFDFGVYVSTYHSAKGLEFETVILPYCNHENFPSQERISAIGDLEEAKSEESQLLYVGVTRARKRLIITYTDGFTELLPRKSSLYQRSEI